MPRPTHQLNPLNKETKHVAKNLIRYDLIVSPIISWKERHPPLRVLIWWSLLNSRHPGHRPGRVVLSRGSWHLIIAIRGHSWLWPKVWFCIRSERFLWFWKDNNLVLFFCVLWISLSRQNSLGGLEGNGWIHRHLVSLSKIKDIIFFHLSTKNIISSKRCNLFYLQWESGKSYMHSFTAEF